MTGDELKSTAILGAIFACRMLGLFMVLPILALYAKALPLATPSLIGLAAGIYGFTQALFQVPFGILSDYWGRKPVIMVGLVLFAIGSLIAAFSDSIIGLIIGRALQGVGAIGSPILALVADNTRAQVRTRAMALIGISIGLTFVIALLLGPILGAYLGLGGIFTLTAFLALGAMSLLGFLRSVPIERAKDSKPWAFSQFLPLWKLYLNIFILHAVLVALFLILPPKIEAVTKLTSMQVWRFYLPVLGIALLGVAPLLRYADAMMWQQKLMQAAMVGLSLGIVILLSAKQTLPLVAGGILFFIAFNFLEACLPSVVSRKAPVANKGGALGIYSGAQFLGMFVGGAVGGYIQQSWGISILGMSCVLLPLIGWLMALPLFTLSVRKQIQI